MLGDTLVEQNLAAVHLVESRGTLPGQDGSLITGRLYGPAIFPQMLQAAQRLVGLGLPVIANGGIYQNWQVTALMAAGVTAIGVGGTLWRIDSMM